MGFPGGIGKKNPSASAGDIRDTNWIPGSGRSPGEGLGNPLQYSCLENPMDRGGWRATVHKAAESWTQLKQLSTHASLPPLAFGCQSLSLKAISRDKKIREGNPLHQLRNHRANIRGLLLRSGFHPFVPAIFVSLFERRRPTCFE